MCCIELIRLLIVACGMLVHSSSMAVWSCWDIGRNWNTLSYTLIQSIQTCSMGDMSGEYAGHARTGMFFSFQKVCTDPCNMGPCIIMLQHEMMVVDERHNNEHQNLITVSLCIQNAINKMHLQQIYKLSSDELYLSHTQLYRVNEEWNVFSAFNPSKCTHTWSSGQPTVQRPGEQLGVRCLAQGHFKSVGYWIQFPAGPRLKPAKL